MANFVEISGGVTEPLSAAHRMKARGEALSNALSQAVSAIRASEDDPETFPSDEFTDSFLANTYHTAPDGSGLPANEALHQLLTGGSDGDTAGLGGVLTNFGENASNAMWQYSGTDDDNAGKIAGA